MKRSLRTAALFILSFAVMTSPSLAQKKKETLPKVPLFVTTVGAVGGLTDPSKDNQDSARDITEALKKSEFITLVKSPGEARLVLTVQGREKGQLTGIGVDLIVRATLLSGETELKLSGSANGGTIMSNGGWSRAAFKVADQVHRWVQDNRVALQ